MKVVFTIPEDKTKYSYPTEPEDVTLGKFVEYMDAVYSKAPQLIKDIDAAIDSGDQEKVHELTGTIDNDLLAKEFYPYFARVVSFFSSVPYTVLIGLEGQGMNVKQLEALYNIIIHALAPPPYVYEKTFQFKGETWLIPDRLMEHATVIEFAEAAQFQASMEQVENGHIKALIDVCAVLIRKEGETYSENIYKRNKKLFEELSLSVVWQIAFFLMNRSRKLGRDFQIYTAALTLGQLKRALKTSQKISDGI